MVPPPVIDITALREAPTPPAPPSSGRYSVPFFVNPDPTTTVRCLPACVSVERPCRYQQVTASELLARRIADGGYMRDEASDRVAPR